MACSTSLQDEHLSGMLHDLALHASAAKKRIEVAAIEGIPDPATCADKLLAFAKELDGLLISGKIETDVLCSLARDGIPLVVLGHLMGVDDSELGRVGLYTVACDNLSSGRQASRYLAARGHRRIAFFCETMPPAMYTSRWLDGYRLGLIDAGIAPCPELVQVAGRSFAGGEPAARAFAAMDDPPTAFVCPDVRTGASFLEAWRSLGRDAGPDSMVLGGHPGVTQRYGMEAFPLIGEDSNGMARAGLQLLEQVVAGQATPGMCVVVPCTSINTQGTP